LTIFISIPWFLPAYKAGGPIQSIANLVNNYTDDITYYIFCSNKDLNNETNIGKPFNEWVVYNQNTHVWYDTGFATKNHFLIQNKKIKPDILYIIGLFNWHYNIIPLFYGKAKKRILSVRGMLHTGALSQKKIKKKIFLFFLKLTRIKNNTSFHATDDAEAFFIKKEFGENTPIYVAGNFAKLIEQKAVLHKEANFLKLITVALISPMKNHLLVLQALANCTNAIEYNIYGPIKDAAYWELCTKQMALLPTNIKVKYHGEIDPTLVENVLAQNHVFIMPSKSENFGHALVEALSCGKPIITSHGTPWNNLLDGSAGINCNEDELSISNAVKFFCEMNAEGYELFSDGAIQYALQKNNKHTLHYQYQQMFTV
jgi:glycosyltransferase involved in cell wall biosynthesis